MPVRASVMRTTAGILFSVFILLCLSCKLLSGIHSAIHSKIRPGNVRRVRTSDECHHRGDIVSLSIALERGRGLLWYRPITRGGGQIRFHWAGLPLVCRSAPAPDLSG